MDYKKVIAAVVAAKKFVVDEDMRHTVKMKGDADFVTAVDYSISAHMRQELGKIAPEVGFMSEEEDNAVIQPTRWILDPIDGTTNLVFDYKMSSISLGLLENGKIVFGVVYNPFSGELFTAERGKGAYLDGKRIYIVDRLPHDSLIEFGAGSTRKYEADEAFDTAKEIFKECLDLRRICSSALAVCFIAAGRLNGYFEKKIKPWDYAAASLILEESGGKSCGYDGNPLQYDLPSGIVCGSPKTFEFLCGKLL